MLKPMNEQNLTEQSEQTSAREREAAMIQSLAKHGATVEADPMPVAGAYIVEFRQEGAVITIRIALRDSGGADLTITNMTTLPENKKRQGLGSWALGQLLDWAHENHLYNVRAVQIQSYNEKFWQRNGFSKDPNPNPSNDFIYKSQIP